MRKMEPANLKWLGIRGKQQGGERNELSLSGVFILIGVYTLLGICRCGLDERV